MKFAGPRPTPLGTSLEVIERCLFHLLPPQQKCRRGLDVANLYLLQATVVLDDELAQFLATFLATHMAFSLQATAISKFAGESFNHLQYPYLPIFTNIYPYLPIYSAIFIHIYPILMAMFEKFIAHFRTDPPSMVHGSNPRTFHHDSDDEIHHVSW